MVGPFVPFFQRSEEKDTMEAMEILQLLASLDTGKIVEITFSKFAFLPRQLVVPDIFKKTFRNLKVIRISNCETFPFYGVIHDLFCGDFANTGITIDFTSS